jgi:hypothetical protein
MAAWLVPAVKAILPYVSSIVAATMPVFTTRKIVEAAAVHIKALAEQLQKTVAALEQGASVAGSRYSRMAALCIGAMIVSGIALCASLIAMFGR